MTKTKPVKSKGVVQKASRPPPLIGNPVQMLEALNHELRVEIEAIETHLLKLEEIRDTIDTIVADTNDAMESMSSGSDKISEAIDLLARDK